jgi:acetate kinase
VNRASPVNGASVISRASLNILALNSGSSSLKFGLYRVGPFQTEMLVSGEAELIGEQNSKFHAVDARGDVLISEVGSTGSQETAVAQIGKILADAKMPMPAAVGHRVVHGGPKLLQHCIIDEAVFDQLKEAIPFAPLHLPSALSVIRFARANFPSRLQVACFDTSFHADLPAVARILPLPRELRSEGIRRYGFHGLSYESIVRQLSSDLPRRLIIAHLGNGASVTAVKDGKSLDTSMGLTPTGGVIMGTRCGDLDPGALIYLMREKNLGPAELEVLIDRRSGLLGISGLDSDMRRLHEAAVSDDDARLAIEMFCYSVRKQIAAMIAVLDGVDLLVFTGGIGENDAAVRAKICAGLSWAGIHLVEAPVAEHPGNVRFIPSQEDEQIARHTWSLQGVPNG